MLIYLKVNYMWYQALTNRALDIIAAVHYIDSTSSTAVLAKSSLCSDLFC